MPAPYSAGSIFVSVVPSFRGNQNDIEKEYKRRGREGAKAFSEEFDKQLTHDLPRATEKAARQSRQQNARAGETAATEYSTAFRKTLGEGLKRASRDLERLSEDGGKGLKIPVDADRKQFMNAMNALIRDVSLTEADIKVGADVDGAIADVDRLIGSMRRLRDASTNPEIRMDMGSALGSMEDAVANVRKRAALNPEGPPQPVQRQLGAFDSKARDRIQSSLAAIPPVAVDADVTPAMAKIIEFRADAYRLLDDIEADVQIDGDDLLARTSALMVLLEGVIESADPEVEIDASFNAAGALAQLKAWKEAVSPTEVKIEPEMGYFRTRLAQATRAAAESLPEVPLDVDASDAVREMARIRAELIALGEDVKIGLDLEEARTRSRELQRELGRLRRENVDIEVDVDAARAIIELEAVDRAADDAERDLHRASRGADDGANSFRAFSGVLLGIATLGPLAIPVIGAAGMAAAAAGPLAVAGAAGLGVFALAVSGVSDAVKAMMDVEKHATKDAKTYADGVRNAGRALATAEQAVAEARRSAADGAVNSARRVRDAERDLTEAQKAARQAQEDLTEARKQASERLLDLQLQIRGGALAERRAYMQLAEAEVAYANALADPGATRTEREQLLLDLDEQKLRVDEVTVSNRRLAEEQADAAAKGIDGSDEVTRANQRAADAQLTLTDAVQGLADAQRDQQRQAADSARAIENAQLRLADAQQDYADAVAKTSASQDTLAQSMAKLSPAGREFAEYLFSLRGYFQELRGVAAAGVLPGVQEWMQDIIDSRGPQFTSIIGGMSTAVGDMFEQWGEALKGDAWSGFFDMLESKGPVFLGQMGDVLTSLGNGTASLLTAFAPAAEDFGNGMVGMAQRFEEWAAGLAQTEGFRDFMEWWERVGPKVLAFFGALIDAVINLGIALAPYGEDLMELFTGILTWIGEMDPSTLGAIAVAVIGIVVAFQTLVGLNALIHGFTAVWGLASAAMALFQGTAIGTTAVLTGIAGVVAIVVASLLLIALGLYLLYQNNEWFRDAVDTAWKGIQSAVKVVADWFQTYVMPVITTVLQAIGDFLGVLWHDVIEPILGVWQIAWGVLWDFIQAMWENVGQPVIETIWSIIQDLWDIVGPIFTLIGMAFQALWWAVEQYWKYVGKPIFDAIIAIVSWLWSNVIGPVLQFIADGFGWLWGIVQSAWENVGKPVFDLVQAVVEGLVAIFQGSFDGIKSIWDALLDVFMAPIVFVVDTVLNKGLIAGINWIASIFTDDDTWIDPIPTDWIPGRATGGVIPGNSPHKRADDVLIRATSGEYMQQVDAVDYYGVGIMEALNEQLIPREALLAGLQGRAYGGLIDPMWDKVKTRFPNARLNSAYRPGDPGYHGQKKAIDLGEEGFDGGIGRPLLAQMKLWLATTFPGSAEIIYNGQGNMVPNRKNGKPFDYSRAMQQEHMNHVHWALNSIADLFAGVGGSGDGLVEESIWGKIGDFISSPLGFLKNIVTNWAGDKMSSGMGQMLMNIPFDFADNIVDTLLGFVGLGKDVAVDMPTSGDLGAAGPVQEQVRAVADLYGWGAGSQWTALSRLIQKESSWNPNAQNPSSSAYGLFQFLNGTWAGTGVAKTSNPTRQAEAGLKYIRDRYGDPASALAFHNKNNWYATGGLIGGPLTPYLHDEGGVIDPGWNLIYNATRKPEASLNPQQLDNIQRIADGAGRGPLLGSLHLPMVASSPREAVDEVMHALDVIDLGGRYGEDVD